MSRSFLHHAGLATVAAAILLAATAIWFALYEAGVTVPPMPLGGPPEQQAAMYYPEWFQAVLGQDRAIRLLGAAAFAMLAIAGVLIARAGDGRTDRLVAGACLSGGGFIAAAAFLVQYAGHGAIVDAAWTQTPLITIGLAAYMVDEVADGLLVGAYALAGVGVLAAGGEGAVERAAGALAGGGLLLLAAMGIIDDPLGYADALRLVVAVVLFPAWAVTLLWRSARGVSIARTATEPALGHG